MLIKFLLDQDSEILINSEDFLVSSQVLELRLDYLREAIMCNKKLVLGKKDSQQKETCEEVKIFSSADGN